jgi:hypothetical protein
MPARDLDLLHNLERHRERVERTRENTARLAKSYLKWQTRGWGEFLNDGVMDFGLTFTEEPSFTFGYKLNQDGSNPDIADDRFPRGFAFVYDYRIVHPLGDESVTYYTGAWCGFVLETVGYQFSFGAFPTAGDPQYVIDWSLQFEGVALKDLPVHLLEAVDETQSSGTGA